MIVRANKSAGERVYLTPKKDYIVVGMDDEYYRVLSDFSEPVLCEKSMFDVVDSAVPADWIWQRISDDEYYADPPGLNAPGFYEAFFDRKDYAINQFNAYLKSIGVDVEARPLDLPPVEWIREQSATAQAMSSNSASRASNTSRIQETRKLLVGVDPSDFRLVSDDFLVPLIREHNVVLFGTLSRCIQCFGLVVYTTNPVTIDDIAAKYDSICETENQSYAHHLIALYIEAIQPFRIGDIVRVDDGRSNVVALHLVTNMRSDRDK